MKATGIPKVSRNWSVVLKICNVPRSPSNLRFPVPRRPRRSLLKTATNADGRFLRHRGVESGWAGVDTGANGGISWSAGGALVRHLQGKLLVIWDGAPIHWARVVKTFLSDGGAQRLWLEQVLGYAPDPNPVESIWHYLKRVRLANVCCRTLKEVRYAGRL